MNAIVPLNIAALRVNNYDGTVVGNFQGKTAVFDKMPWSDPDQSNPNSASTGDKIYHTLNVTPAGAPQYGPNPPLGTGVHLHWELPNFFRKGTQATQGANIVFPHAPNRWLVTRYLSVYNQTSTRYESRPAMSWIVESDFVSPEQPADLRPVTSVPLPATPVWKQQPYMYMGRVVELGQWNPSAEPASSYLPYYKGADGNQLYLTSIGFVGAYFGSYYPECNSVFGFWDTFSDQNDVYTQITNGNPVQFRASYQVTGWVNESASDPLANIVADVTRLYNDYVARCTANNVAPVLTPLDFFNQVTNQGMKWSFNQQDLSFTLNDGKIATLNVPTQTICAGTTQEVVWNMLNVSGPAYFLKSTGKNPSVWNAETEIAIGNSTEEALAALLKYDMGQTTDDPNVLENYEFLLDALQLGLLKNLEKTPNKLISLEEALHSNGFSSLDGGYLWMITDDSDSDAGPQEQQEVTLPLDLAEKLFLLNQAQKNYDMGRGALSTMRRQLFMDWIRYVKIFVNETPDPNITTNTMNNFIWTSSGGELNAVINQGNAVGILLYNRDDSGAITSIQQPTSNVSTTSLAYLAYDAFQDVQNALAAFNSLNENANWILQCGPAPSFYMPAEPVVIMEGSMMEPPQRNGDGTLTFVRLSSEILSQLNITYSGSNFSVNVSSLTGVPSVAANMPPALQGDIQALTGEAFLITPMLAGVVETALAAAGGTNNPAVASASDFTTSLMYAQGGLSPLDLNPNTGGIPAPGAPGLYEAIRANNYQAAANSSVTVAAPQSLQITFTNTQNNGWAPDSIAWNTQAAYPEFTNTRVDPFLPIFMIWSVNLNPLLWEQDKINQVYSAGNITDFFTLDTDGVDYKYNMNGNTPVAFTAGSVSYGHPATMRSGASGVLSFQITSYINNNPGDPENPTLQKIADLYGSRKILSQALSGFNINQVLADYVAQLPVENLVFGPKKDSITVKVATAATATPNDSWYDQAFNNVEPISTGPLAQGNFGPLRAGFMQITSIEVVDVFGQRMDLYTPGSQPGQQPLSCITSYAMSPQPDDTANQGKIFLAPRILTPTRLWFRWLSATHDTNVAGVSNDFVEMNSHPATAPICGWIMPNHLDDNLFFYDADGNPIGTFGVEHSGGNPVNKYRTRAGNLKNPTSDLATDIGPLGTPLVNLHLANYMWYLNAQPADYLKALMTTMQDSETFITPSNSSQDAALAVFIGRPLALTRAVVGLETLGNLLPLSQADNNSQSPFPQDVNAVPQRVNYTDRMQYSAANLGSVQFPMRLGDLANLDDGLIGYLVEGTGENPYTGQTFFAPAAPTGVTGIAPPADTTLKLTLNAAAFPLTMLVDPRAPVHATTGVLGVNELSIPTDQYSQTMGSLAVNFVTRPMLKPAQGLAVPLPQESGYAWSWITPGATAETPLKPNAVDQSPAYGYSPQTIQEGWLQLSPDETPLQQKPSQRNNR